MTASFLRWVVLSVVLWTVGARAREPGEQAGSTWRNLILSGRPELPRGQVRIAAGTAVVLRFEAQLDSVRTQLPEWARACFAPLGVADRLVTLLPLKGVAQWREVPLLVALEDGTVAALQLVPGPPEVADRQVEVFLNPFTQGALLAALELAEADNEALQHRLDETLIALDRYKREEDSPEALLAALLLDERMTRNFSQVDRLRVETEQLGTTIEVYSIQDWTAVVFKVENRDRSRPWTLRDITFEDLKSGEPRGFVFRTRPASIPPRGSGRVVVVTRALPAKSDRRYSLLLRVQEGTERMLLVAGFNY